MNRYRKYTEKKISDSFGRHARDKNTVYCNKTVIIHVIVNHTENLTDI